MHKLINTVSAIKSVENLNMIISFVFPKLRNNTRVTDDKDTGHMIDDQVKFITKSLEIAADKYITILSVCSE